RPPPDRAEQGADDHQPIALRLSDLRGGAAEADTVVAARSGRAGVGRPRRWSREYSADAGVEQIHHFCTLIETRRVPSKQPRSRSAKSPRSDREPQGAPRLTGVTSALLVAIGLIVAGGWAYSTSFPGVFVMDDKFAIADNPNIKTLWPLTTA